MKSKLHLVRQGEITTSAKIPVTHAPPFDIVRVLQFSPHLVPVRTQPLFFPGGFPYVVRCVYNLVDGERSYEKIARLLSRITETRKLQAMAILISYGYIELDFVLGGDFREL